MKPIIDYHIHTYLCGHAEGSPEEYVEEGIKKGFKYLGFSDHLPFLSHRDPSVTMSIDELPVYKKIVLDLKTRYKDKITVLFGIEADYMRGYEPKTKELLNNYPFDYIIGSVHFIDDWAFDNPLERPKFDEHNINGVYKTYFKLLRESAETKMFDIMAHVDLVKKFGDRPTEDMTEEIEHTAQIFKKTNVCIEINTSGLRKPVKEIYPSLPFLKIYCKYKVPIVFGSDSHAPDDVGKNFDIALKYAKEAGYKEYVLFSGRKIIEKIKI